jgi:hypothetical protein
MRSAHHSKFVAVSLFGFAVIVVVNAWMADDAFITLRTVDNFVAGHGLTWNVQERVQAYTHPLWMFLLSLLYVFTREPYFTGIFLGLGVGRGHGHGQDCQDNRCRGGRSRSVEHLQGVRGLLPFRT